MKISVIIPVYNIEGYLVRCVDSVLQHDDIQLEVILINDGSTDNSGDICDKYARKDTRVKVLHQKNSGVSSARNRGIESANGDWVCFVDADDWIESSSLEKISKIGNEELADIVVARSFKNENGLPGYEYFSFDKKWERRVFRGLELYIDFGYGRGSACGVIYRRSFLMKYRLQFAKELKIGEDSLFFSLCLIYANRVTFADAHLYNVYERQGSALRSWNFEKILSMVDNLYFIDDYIISHPQLSSKAINVLHHCKYGIISNIFNYFHHAFSISNYFILRKKLRGGIRRKLSIGDIMKNESKVRILNFSLDVFAATVLIKNQIAR